MKRFSPYKIVFLSILICLLNKLPANEISGHWNDINSDKKITTLLFDQQVVFTKPDQKISFNNKEVSNIKVNKFSLAAPSLIPLKKMLQINIPDKENNRIDLTLICPKGNISLTIITGIKDKSTKDGVLEFNGVAHTIGQYPDPTSSSVKVNYFKKDYKAPTYFFLWDDDLIERPVSKSIKYGDIVQKPDFEKPEIPRPSKIFTLSYETMNNFEKIILATKSKVNFNNVTILSFYRTPDYNARIGASRFSRHIYGDGIDWYIDEEKPYITMDDLNKDGKINVEDAQEFFNSYKTLVENETIEPGGFGIYFTKKGASMHYDSRGHMAKWGKADAWWPDSSLPPKIKAIEDKLDALKKKK